MHKADKWLLKVHEEFGTFSQVVFLSSIPSSFHHYFTRMNKVKATVILTIRDTRKKITMKNASFYKVICGISEWNLAKVAITNSDLFGLTWIARLCCLKVGHPYPPHGIWWSSTIICKVISIHVHIIHLHGPMHLQVNDFPQAHQSIIPFHFTECEKIYWPSKQSPSRTCKKKLSLKRPGAFL